MNASITAVARRAGPRRVVGVVPWGSSGSQLQMCLCVHAQTQLEIDSILQALSSGSFDSSSLAAITTLTSQPVSVCVCVCERVCVYVCVCVRERQLWIPHDIPLSSPPLLPAANTAKDIWPTLITFSYTSLQLV